ncbi:MAG: uL15 family ribosomal protein [archaeon]
MVRLFSKRSRRERGHRSHGYGAGKKHRGKGNKGGKGYAWDKHLWVYMLKYDPDHFGKHGFQSPGQKANRLTTINVGLLDATAETMVSRKLAEFKGGEYLIDCGKLGIEKILGSGKVSRKLTITNCVAASEGAIAKVEAAGGKIVLPEPRAPKKAPKTDVKTGKIGPS